VSAHNRNRRRPHRVLTVAQQQEVAAAKAAEHQAIYPKPPVYRTHVSTHKGPKEPVGPVLKPLADVTKHHPAPWVGVDLAAGLSQMASMIVVFGDQGRRGR